MMDAEITVGHFESGRSFDTRLFAFTDVTPQRGEYTYDLMAYHGFKPGVGIHEHGATPAWTNQFLVFRFPSISDALEPCDKGSAGNECRGKVVARFIELLVHIKHWYWTEQGIIVNTSDARKFITYLQRMANVHLTTDLVNNILQRFDDEAKKVHENHMHRGIIVLGTTIDRKAYMGFGGPAIRKNGKSVLQHDELKHDDLEVLDLGDPKFFNWEYNCDASSFDHAKSIIGSLGNRHFTKSLKGQVAMLGWLDEFCDAVRLPSSIDRSFEFGLDSIFKD